MSIVQVDLEKYRAIAHNIRREARAVEFAPHDEIIMKQIPGVDYQKVEAFRQTIREKYAIMQLQIDAAETVDQIKSILP